MAKQAIVKNNILSHSGRAELFEQLCEYIRGSHLSIKEISKRSGVYQATIYFWLDYTTQAPRIDTMLKVADAIGLEIVLRPKARNLKRVK